MSGIMDELLSEKNVLGLRCVRIPRCQNGFGFTLRHFIVYPPDLYANESISVDRRKRLGTVTEPVDTIFVKSVRDNGPAAHSGLCVGDRIVSVNGERIVGKSYDQVVQLIQKSTHKLILEVSPKQFDTLQLFYEEKAYRPETNQRPIQPNFSTNNRSRSVASTQYRPDDYYSETERHLYPYSYESVFSDQQLQSQPYCNNNTSRSYLDMSSAYPNQQQQQQHQQLFSHLPRPTPYKSSSTQTWSHLGQQPLQQQKHQQQQQQQQQQRHQPQSYYPFQTPAFGGGKNGGSGVPGTTLWGILEDQGGTKSAESVLAHSSSSSLSAGNNNRYGSMECLPSVSPLTVPWKNSPGYRFSISTGPEESARMFVTMTGEVPDPSTVPLAPPEGYETKMANRIRRSTEQKEEFLRRPPNQPVQWASQLQQQQQQPSTMILGFPKEFYAQPQRFQKVPWPPENKIVPPVSVITSTCSSSVSDSTMTVTIATRAPLLQQNSTQLPTMVVSHPKDYLRAYTGGSLDETTNRKRENAAVNNQLQHQLYPTSSVNVSVSGTTMQDSMSPYKPTLTASERNMTTAKNRITVVGSGKLHCDPPPDWKPPSIDETEIQTTNAHLIRQIRPNHLALPAGTSFEPSAHASNGTKNSHYMSTSLDSDVILRKRETDPDYDNDRLVRRVSYLKATSSPIDMDRKGSNPTTPTKSPSSEFRHFGSLSTEKSPDGSEVIRESQVHFKVRAGDSKKGGYYRSWRQGWAQIRRSGCLYLSKEKICKETISSLESDVIVSIGLKDGISIEPAEDYTKRKYVLRIKTCYSSNLSTESSNQTQIPVEILIQTDDCLEMNKWLHTLQQQQDNNNYYSKGSGVLINPNEMSSPKSSLLRSLLTAPSISTHQSTATTIGITTSTISAPISASNYLSVANQNLMTSTAVGVSGATSPKSKTWKGKVVRQLRKIRVTSTSSSPSYGSFNAQTCIPESGGTIGVPLEDCPQSEHSLVPKLMEFCVDIVESRGLGIVGIYRIPGNNAAVGALTESLNRGNEPNPEQDPRWNDVHVISSLLKSFLRKLPDPVLTSEHYPEFIRAASDPDSTKALEKLQILIHDLPDINYETLRHLILHLRKVADHSEKNRMEPRNLAIVFGPTVVRTSAENVESLVNDMQQQCRIVELLINNAEEIFKEKDGESPLPEEQPKVYSLPHSLPTSPPPKIEIDIRASLIQAAQRKVLKQAVQPNINVTQTLVLHNTYGLPPNPPERDRPVDESGLIRSYAGLGEETEQRVRQFEMETRAILHRDGRSPSLLPTVLPDFSTSSGNNFLNVQGNMTNVGNKSEDVGKISREKMRLEAEWRKAKDDLENEDFYDQLADNPSSIVHHPQRGLPAYPLTSYNVSSSSISSTNSGSASNTLISPYGTTTWPIRLGPAPFKSQFSTPALPPKPPGLGHLGSRKGPTITNPSPLPSLLVSPIRKVGSVERLGGTGSESFDNSKVEGRGTLKRLKNFDSSSNMNYDSKAFGSLDSLRDIHIVNGSREDLSPRSSDGGDLVTSLSKTLDQKLLTLRPGKKTDDNIIKKSENENVEEKNKQQRGDGDVPAQINCNGTLSSTGTGNEKGKRNRVQMRRNSMIDRTKKDMLTLVSGDPEVEEAIKISYRDPSLHRSHISGSSWSGPLILKANGHESLTNLTKEAKTVSNKLKREIRRRHSLSGTADILRIVLEDRAKTKKNLEVTNFSSDALATALTANNILESHV